MTFKKLLILIVISFLVFATKTPVAYGNCKTFTIERLPGNCSDTAAITKIINDAISIGAPVYNAGLHIDCYRIYEWAAYKILYEYGNNCKDVEKILKAAIEKSHGDYSDTEKAWIMRVAFDKILGQPTQLGAPKENNNSNNQPPVNG